MLEFTETEIAQKPDACVIWLHGIGTNGHDFKGFVPEFEIPKHLNIRFVFPHAPERPVSMHEGKVMRAWYDLKGCNNLAEDEIGIREAAKEIFQLIDEQKKRGIPASKIILAGFSQGGGLALFAGLRYPEKLRGIVVLSGYLPLAHTLKSEMKPANKKTPILMLHGKKDKIVHFQEAGCVTKEILIKNGVSVEWHEYRMGHALCCQELADISAWLQKICAKKFSIFNLIKSIF